MTLSVEPSLSIKEQEQLQEHEVVIARGLKTFNEVGNALLAIRDGKLYREAYKTFEDYCRERWSLGERRAYQFMDAARVVNNLKVEPMVQLPDSERQARPLTELEPEQQRVVWEVVEKTAPKGRITAAHVQSTVNVLKEVLATGAIDNGEGVAIPVTEATVEHLKAAVTEETYERTKRQEEYIHQKQEAKEKKREEQFVRKNAPVIIPEDDRFKLFSGDLESAGAAIDDGSVDIIITDPPYPREFLPVYEKLARLGARVLKPGGSMLVMVGQSYLFDIGALMTPHLRYHWTVGYMTPGGQAAQLWQRRVNSFWKPVLWFVNGEYEGDWIGDVAKSDVNDNDKRFHKWGQSESGIADLVNKFTYPGQLILDPFVGGGTTGVVAVNMQRRFIGIDIDPEAIESTRKRLFDSSQENVA